MSARTRLTLFSLLLIAAAVTAACAAMLSLARAHARSAALEAGLADYRAFAEAFRLSDAGLVDERSPAYASNLKYLFQGVEGAQEFALCAGAHTVSNNTGVDARSFLGACGRAVPDMPQLRCGFAHRDGTVRLVLGGALAAHGHVYHLALVRDVTPAVQGIRALALRCAAICALLLLAAGLCMYLLVSGALRPLSALQAGVKRMADGEYGAYVAIRGRNEFASLAESYNRMAHSIGTKVQELEKTAEDRRLLLAALSHEMRTPVTALAACAHSLTHVRLTAAQRRETLSLIESECMRLERLSTRLMQLIGAAEREAPPRVPLPCAALTEAVAALLGPLARQAGVSLELEQDGAPVYRGEMDLLLCLFSNLFDNAVKAGARRVRIAFLPDRICISDDGRGIPADRLPEITRPFYRLDPSRSGEGFGLGLALVERIARLHGARLVIESEPGRGTRVSLAFESLQFHDDFARPIP